MKYRYMVLGSFFTIIIIFIISIIAINFNDQEIIHIKEISNYGKKITSLKNAIEEVEDKSCKKDLEKMADRINKTYFKKDITIEKYYQAYYKNDISFTDLYNNIISSCKIEENDELAQNIIMQSIYPEEIKNKYLLRYELVLKDNISRESLAKPLNEKGTYTTKTLELNILKALIEEVQDEKDL